MDSTLVREVGHAGVRNPEALGFVRGNDPDLLLGWFWVYGSSSLVRRSSLPGSVQVDPRECGSSTDASILRSPLTPGWIRRRRATARFDQPADSGAPPVHPGKAPAWLRSGKRPTVARPCRCADIERNIGHTRKLVEISDESFGRGSNLRDGPLNNAS
jgi:hypothetical protein